MKHRHLTSRAVAKVAWSDGNEETADQTTARCWLQGSSHVMTSLRLVGRYGYSKLISPLLQIRIQKKKTLLIPRGVINTNLCPPSLSLVLSLQYHCSSINHRHPLSLSFSPSLSLCTYWTDQSLSGEDIDVSMNDSQKELSHLHRLYTIFQIF